MIVTLDRQGRELSVGLFNPVLPGRNPDPANLALNRCSEGYYYWNALFDTVYTVNYAGRVYPRYILFREANHVTQEDKVLADGSCLMILTPDVLYHYINWVFKQPGIAGKDIYDKTLFRKLADFGNPVLMIVR